MVGLLPVGEGVAVRVGVGDTVGDVLADGSVGAPVGLLLAGADVPAAWAFGLLSADGHR